MKTNVPASITHRVSRPYLRRFGQVALALLLGCQLPATALAAGDERERFRQAWGAASHGDHARFRELSRGLEGYLLFPYLRYEELRERRARAPAAELAAFLDAHREWAFTDGLRNAWLKSLAQRRLWQDLMAHGGGSADTEIRCHLARARIELGLTAELLSEVQALWAVGRSQPDACDPAFKWLRDEDGITPALAWERVRLAMLAGNPRFTLYLARFIPAAERVWLERWQKLNAERYRGLQQARHWPDRDLPRMIAAISLQRLASYDAAQAMGAFRVLDGHFQWEAGVRGATVREIALQAAVSLAPDTSDMMREVPDSHRDPQLLEWWARQALSAGDWTSLQRLIGQLPAESRTDGRWRYWLAIAHLEQGRQAEGIAGLRELALDTSYYAFLAADRLQHPYTICPREPEFDREAIRVLGQRDDLQRALELRAVGLHDWAVAEWSRAAGRLSRDELPLAAAVAHEAGWHDRAIHALGDSGELRYYAWRFPMPWQSEVAREANRQQLDPAWVFGVMRSESALMESARSPAGAMGLMQVMPNTARRLARSHGLAYTGRSQLRDGEQNIRFGTTFMRELMDRFEQNPVLVMGAYNAGPRAVERWLSSRPSHDTEAWIETLPYYETRDYIPRVLAFTAIYDWQINQKVQRISSRMPGIDSGTIGNPETAEVVCLAARQDA